MTWTYDKSYRLTSPFGMRMHPVYKVPKFHKGVDLVVSPTNGPLYAFVAGEVLHAKEGMTGSGFGKMGIVVAIKDDKGYLHCYAHLSAAVVKVGQRVVRGQMIGRQGSTGVSTGPHLHYEIRKRITPSFGWTEDQGGVVEPTQYLFDYFKPKEDQPMPKDEQSALDKLSVQVQQLSCAVETLPTQIKSVSESIPAQKWFVSEFGSCDLEGLISDPNMTAEGWRILAISLRMQGLGKGTKK